NNFAVAESTLNAGSTTVIKTIRLSKTLSVILYTVSNKLYVIAVSFTGNGSPTAGAVVTINNAATTSIDGIRLTNTSFAVSYCDEGGDDYLGAVVCTVSTVTITKGTEKLLVSSALDQNGTGICSPRSGVIAVAHMLAGDDYLDVIAATYSGTTIDAPGSVVELAAADSMFPVMCSQFKGQFCLGYRDADDSDKFKYILGAVSSSGVVTKIGSGGTIASTATVTSLRLLGFTDGRVLFSWIDSTFGHVLSGSMDDGDESLTVGSELEITAEATLTFDVCALDADEFVSVYENDDVSDYVMVTTFTRLINVLTKGNQDVAVEGNSRNTTICSLDDNNFVIGFTDAGNSSYLTVQWGKKLDHLIDVRSNVASAVFNGFMLSKNFDGLGRLAAYQITGTTNGSANTVMGTKPTLPFRKHKDVIVLFKDEGMYIEDDGTDAPKKSGIDETDANFDGFQVVVIDEGALYEWDDGTNTWVDKTSTDLVNDCIHPWSTIQNATSFDTAPAFTANT
ncbi:hypothetical protein LCGC14_2474170, partial [marine sediment metagenome]